MKKKITLFIFFTLLLVATILVVIDISDVDAISVKEFTQLREEEQKAKFRVLGNIHQITQDSLSIVDLEFPEYKITFDFNSNDFLITNYALGETIIVEINRMSIEQIDKFNPSRAQRYLATRKPLIKTSNVEHHLGDEVFKIELENIGIRKVSYENLYDENFGYYLLYRLNDNLYAFHPIGDFGHIYPGQSSEVEFPFDRNVLSAMQQGVNEISFVWAQKSLHDEDFKILLESEPVEIFLEDN